MAVSSRWTIENKLIVFLKKSASPSKNVLYIFVPRYLNKDYANANFPENISIPKDLNLYQTVKEANFHATVYSTFALEAPALGVPNILITNHFSIDPTAVFASRYSKAPCDSLGLFVAKTLVSNKYLRPK